jgi:D-aspartate ligase
MKKVYYPQNRDEAGNTVAALRYYGYGEGIILQKFIKNAEIYVYTALYNKRSECDFGVFGKVVLEEVGETSSGNHSAIITEERCEITEKLDKLLFGIGYTGFANFDILKADGKFYVLELNARQGRSCDYIRCAGVNIAERLLFALGIVDYGGRRDYEKIFWHYPTLRVCMKYMSGKDKREAKRLKKAKRAFSALSYKRDLLLNPRRASYVLFHSRRLGRKFKKDYSSLRSV